MTTLFDFLKPFSKIYVTGPQRSGTRVAAKMIARDLGLRYIDEDVIGFQALAVQNMAEFYRILNEDDGFVMQAPATAYACQEAPDDVAVVFIVRDIDDIIASQERIGWTELYESIELARYGASEGPIAQVKYDAWQWQKQELAHPFELEYEDLATHPMWVTKEKRGEFSAGQTYESFGRIGIGVPYYSAEPEFWLSWSWLMATGLEDGDLLMNRPPHVPMCVRMPLAHNALFRYFLTSDLDTCCIVEDDHYFPYDQLTKMRYKPVNQNFDIVCASYVRRSQYDIPLMMGWDFSPDATAYDNEAIFDLRKAAAETGTMPYEGAAFGFTLIRRWVLEEMLGDNDPSGYEWAEIQKSCSLDIPFYWKARELGARVGVDRDNWIGHVGRYNFTPGYYRDWLNARIAEEKQQQEATNGEVQG